MSTARYDVEHGRVRQVDHAEAGEELDRRIAAEGDKPPEDQRVREARERTFEDGPALPDYVDEQASDAKCGVVGGERVGRRRNEADSSGHLRGESPDRPEDENPQQEDAHWAIIRA